MTGFNLITLLPEIFLAIAAMALLLVGAFNGNGSTKAICYAAVGALLIAGGILIKMSWHDNVILSGMFRFDYFAGYLQVLILIGLIASILLSVKYLSSEAIDRFEYPILVLTAGIGMMLMVSANNFLALYMSLELQSLSLYVLAAFLRNSARSAEAGVKYVTLGALSSGMLLFGISLIYGFTGSIDYGAITASILGAGAPALSVILGLVFILAGVAFKISAAPFHMWTPDVYQGAPTCVTALFAIVPKVAAMGLLARLLYEPFGALHEQWLQIIYFLAVASMAWGAFAAIAQENIKRLMAYSSIGNMGYALVAIAAGGTSGLAALLLYMTIYMIATAGAFGVVISMRRDGVALDKISDLAGLSQTKPAMAYVMAIIMFSMSGIPPMAGFFGKLVVFNAAVGEGMYILAVIGVVTSVVAAYYYLRVIKVMFFDEAKPSFDKVSFASKIVMAASVIFVLAFIFKPALIVEQTQKAAVALIPG